MNILVKFQPDITILMVMGGRLTRYGHKHEGIVAFTLWTNSIS
jgi:hypothetical protein